LVNYVICADRHISYLKVPIIFSKYKVGHG
jgi:hypothetical protein